MQGFGKDGTLLTIFTFGTRRYLLVIEAQYVFSFSLVFILS